MNKLKEELKDLYVKHGYRLDFDLMWLWINQNYISKEQILNLECLKGEEIDRDYRASIEEAIIRNQLRKEIIDEIKKIWQK